MQKPQLILLISMALIYILNLLVFYNKVQLPNSIKLLFKKTIQTNQSSFDISTGYYELRKENGKTNNSPYIDPVSRMGVNKIIPDINVTHTILHWNPHPWLIKIIQGNDMSLCTYNNCRISYDRKSFNQSSAIVFNIADSGIGDKPPVSQHHRNPNQAWIFFTIESPVHTKSQEVIKPSWHNVFNWSWTYSRRSDIFQPYGFMVSGNNVSTKNYSDIFRKKTKTAVWLVSNCKTHSKREDYVKILQKYVDVDIFGHCGKTVPEDVATHFNMNYKFYISFENSLCEDYVTEKLFHYYKLDIITVVRGTSNYDTLFPNGSLIDATTFSSISELAKYMRNLAENEDEYIRYLKIKDMYNVYGVEFSTQHALCYLCEKLNNIDRNRNTISDALQWLGKCISPIINE